MTLKDWKIFSEDRPKSSPDAIPVSFKGRSYFLTRAGALGLPEHFDQFGNLHEFLGESYAHLFEDGDILRHFRKIGRVEDLIIRQIDIEVSHAR